MDATQPAFACFLSRQRSVCTRVLAMEILALLMNPQFQCATLCIVAIAFGCDLLKLVAAAKFLICNKERYAPRPPRIKVLIAHAIPTV